MGLEVKLNRFHELKSNNLHLRSPMKFSSLNVTKRKATCLALALVTLAAWAKTYGPFYVASAGAKYAQTTFALDQENEWEAAYTLSALYLWNSKTLSDAIKKSILGSDDVIRVVYADGQIADFTAVDMTTAGIRLKKKIASAAAQDYDSPTADRRCAAKMSGLNSISIDTGYYGTIDNSEVEDDGTIDIVGGWIDTGTVSYTIPKNIQCS